jgi:hypothetical protein
MAERTVAGHLGLALRWRVAERHRLTLFLGQVLDVHRDDAGGSRERGRVGYEVRYDGELGGGWSIFGGVSQLADEAVTVSGGVAWRLGRRWRLGLELSGAREKVSSLLTLIGAW